MTRRLPPQQRRRQYLDAAVELLTDRFQNATADSVYALAHVRIADVAARAGVSKGALYHIWPQQEAYWTDLLRAVFADMAPFGESYGAWLRSIDTDEPDDTPTIGELFEEIFRARAVSSSVLTLMTLAAYRHDASIHDAVRRQIDTMTELYDPMVRDLLAAAGRRLRPDVDPRTLVMVFRAIQDGMVFRRSFSPDLFAPVEVDGQRIGPFAMTLEALLVHYSEPIDPDGPDEIPLGSILGLPLQPSTVQRLRVWRENHAFEPDRTNDDAGARYIAVGLELLNEFTRREPNALTLDGLGNLRLSDVAEAVGVSKGSLYHIWPSQDLFRVDVLNHLLSSSNDTSAAALTTARVPADPVERVMTMSDFAFDLLKDDMRFYARFGFTFMSARPEVAAVLDSAEIEIRELYIGFLKEALEEQGRRLRTCIGTDLFRLCVEASLYGACLVYRSSPEMFDGYRNGPTRGPRAPSRFAEIIKAMWTHFSEPVTD